MKKPYIYNLKTHTLHIQGFCPHTFKKMNTENGYKCFSTEDEAVAFDRRTVSMCKLCMKKRDNMIKLQK